MQTRSMVVAGMTAAAVAGLAAPAFAAPAEPGKQPVTPQQCTASNGKVQRADDGVGTCVGGSKYDGHIISDVSTTRQQPGTSGPSGTAPSSGYAQPGYAQPAPQYGQAPGYYTGPGGTFYTAPPPQAQPAAPAPQRSAPAQTAPSSSSSQDQANSTDEATDSGDDDGN